MNFQPVRVGLLLQALATMPDDAEVYVRVSRADRSQYHAPLLTVHTNHVENWVELGGPHRPESA